MENKLREVEAAISANEFDKRRLQQNNERLEQKNKVLETDQRNLDALIQTETQQEASLIEEKNSLVELQEEVFFFL